MSYILDTTLPLVSGYKYHIFNRGNHGQNIFFLEKNYFFFLRKYAQYMNDYWDTYSYALLPNHFHLAVEVKPKAQIIEKASIDFLKVSKNFLNKYAPVDEIFRHSDLLSFKNLISLNSETYKNLFQVGEVDEFQEKLLEWVVSERFRRFLMSYAKAINNQEKLNGSLFQKLFRRKVIENETYLAYLILYHHRNPIHHNMALKLNDWVWTSYSSFLLDKRTKLERKKVLDLFGGRSSFIAQHFQYISDWKDIEKWGLE